MSKSLIHKAVHKQDDPETRFEAKRKRLTTAVAVLTLLVFSVAGMVATTSPAYAASGDYGLVWGANHRVCPDTRCTTRQYIPARTWVRTWCWRDAGSARGTNRWFRVRYNGLDAWVSASTMTRQPSVPYCSDFRPNETLFAGQTIWSGNGSYKLTMQSDGNLVVYGPSGAIWSARTGGQPGARASMQSDGHLVVYIGHIPVWVSGTNGNPGAYAVMQSDSNFVIYTGSYPLFASNWYTQPGRARPANVPDSTQCTWLAMDRFRSDTGVYPALWGDAGNWDDSARAAGWRVQTTPATHSIVVFEKSCVPSCGTRRLCRCDPGPRRRHMDIHP